MSGSNELEEALSIKEPKSEKNPSISQSIKKDSKIDLTKMNDDEKKFLLELFASMISKKEEKKRQAMATEVRELQSMDSSIVKTRPAQPMTSTPINQTSCKTPFQVPVSPIKKSCFTFEHLKKYKNIDLLGQCTLNCTDDGPRNTDLCRQHLMTQESRIPTCYGRSSTKRVRSAFRMRSSSSLSSSCQNSESNVQVQEKPTLPLRQTKSRPHDKACEQQTDFEELIKSCLKCKLASHLGSHAAKAVNITRPTFCVSFQEAPDTSPNQQIVEYKGDKKLKFQESSCFCPDPVPTECNALANIKIPPPHNAPCLQENPQSVAQNYSFTSPQRQTRNCPEVFAEQSCQPVVTYPSTCNSEYFRNVTHPSSDVFEQSSKSMSPPCKEQCSKVSAYSPCSVEHFPRPICPTCNVESFPKTFCLPCYDQYPKPPVYPNCNSLQYPRNVYSSCLDQRSEAISLPCHVQYPKPPYVHPTMDPSCDTERYAKPASYPSHPCPPSYPSPPSHQSCPSYPCPTSYPSPPSPSFPSHQSYPPHPSYLSHPSHPLQTAHLSHTFHPSYPPYNIDPFPRPMASPQRNQMLQSYEEMPFPPLASDNNFPSQSRIRKPSLEKVNKSSQTCPCIGEEPSRPFAVDPQVNIDPQTRKYQEIAKDIQALKLSKRDCSQFNLGGNFPSNFRRSNNNSDNSFESKHVFFKAENEGYNFRPTSGVPNQVIVPRRSCRSDYSQINQPKLPNTFACLPNAQKKDEQKELILNMNFIPCCGGRTCWPCSTNKPRFYSIKIP